MQTLFPEGIEGLDDLPYSLFFALQTATSVISWRENLEKDEVPPRSIWLDADKLDAWFQDVERKRKAKWGGDKKPIEDPVQNDAARALIVE